MGYTHYFPLQNEVKDVDLVDVEVKVQAVLDEHKDIIQYEYDQAGKPVCEVQNGGRKLFIRFNGIGNDGHETFVFDSTDTEFNFCKTARKPYDIVVCKVLLILKEAFGEALDLGSDGFSSHQPEDTKYSVGDTVNPEDLDGDWAKALEWFNETFTRAESFVVDDVYGTDGCYFSYKFA